MTDNKPPAFQLYAGDFLTDTMALPHPVVGIYIRLLCYSWVNGPIPANTIELMRITGCLDPKEMADAMAKLSSKWKKGEQKGTLFNPRLETERKKLQGFWAAKVAAGKKSGEVRRNKSRTKSNSSSSSSSSSSSLTTTTSSLKLPAGGSYVDLFGKPENVPIKAIVDLYHEHCPNLPIVRVLTAPRKRAIKARWNSDKKYQKLKWWGGFFQYITEKCAFLNGSSDNGWQANIDFIIRESGFVNILEGKYEDKKDG